MIESWWAVALRGAAAVLFGLLALSTPDLTLGGLATLFAVYALVDGVLALLLGRPDRGAPGARSFAADGMVGVALSVVALLWADLTAFTLMFLVGLRFVASGVAALLATLRARRTGHRDRLLAATAAASLLLGLVLVVLPAMDIAGVLLWIALSALVVGSLLVMLGLRHRGKSRAHAGDDEMMAAA